MKKGTRGKVSLVAVEDGMRQEGLEPLQADVCTFVRGGVLLRGIDVDQESLRKIPEEDHSRCSANSVCWGPAAHGPPCCASAAAIVCDEAPVATPGGMTKLTLAYETGSPGEDGAHRGQGFEGAGHERGNASRLRTRRGGKTACQINVARLTRLRCPAEKIGMLCPTWLRSIAPGHPGLTATERIGRKWSHSVFRQPRRSRFAVHSSRRRRRQAERPRRGCRRARGTAPALAG